jgi:ribonuclease VapC
MFVDASALVSMTTLEPDSDALSLRLATRSTPAFTSPVALYEAILAIVRVTGRPAAEVKAVIRAIMAEAGIAIADTTEKTALAAIDAHARYGKGRHPAALNMVDCFSYAHAKELGLPLLYKGDDFARTDLA